MPRSLIWWTTALMLLGLLVTPVIYLIAMATDPVVTEHMSPDSDSWGIPIGGSIVFALLLSPLILGVTAACTRRYTAPKLFAWRRDRPLRSIVVTAIAVAVLGPVLWFWLLDFLAAPPAYEYDWVPLLILGVLWVGMLRAAAISMAGPKSTLPAGTSG